MRTRKQLSAEEKSKRTKNARRRIKQQFIDCMGGCCQICKYKKSNSALEFHHIDRSDKEFQIGRKSASWAAQAEELKKCVLLCANCHREVHDGIAVVPENAAKFTDLYSNLIFFKGKYFTLEEFKAKIEYCIECSAEISQGTKTKRCWDCFRKNPYKGANGEIGYHPSKKQIKYPEKEILSDMMWTMPAQRVAEMFNISDTTLKRHCQQMGIERPPVGYFFRSGVIIKSKKDFTSQT